MVKNVLSGVECVPSIIYFSKHEIFGRLALNRTCPFPSQPIQLFILQPVQPSNSLCPQLITHKAISAPPDRPLDGLKMVLIAGLIGIGLALEASERRKANRNALARRHNLLDEQDSQHGMLPDI